MDLLPVAVDVRGIRAASSKTLSADRMEEPIEIEGRILTVLAGTMFRVELDNKHQVLAHISGKMRKRFIRLTVGDRVRIEPKSKQFAWGCIEVHRSSTVPHIYATLTGLETTHLMNPTLDLVMVLSKV